MNGEADSRLARMKRLPPRLRVVHLAALLRSEADGTLRAAELARLLAAQPALADGHRG
jgi:hypothetical protein